MKWDELRKYKNYSDYFLFYKLTENLPAILLAQFGQKELQIKFPPASESLDCCQIITALGLYW